MLLKVFIKAMALRIPLLFLLASALVISQQLEAAMVVVANSSIAPSPMVAPGPDCPTICGNVEIPYPFGLSDECSWKGQFTITCNHSFSPPKPFAGNIEVIDISLEKGEGRVLSPVSYICYNSSNTTTENGVVGWRLDFTGSPGLISSTRNEFVAIGCYTVALIQGREDGSFSSGCISTCVNLHEASEDGAECAGLGCCQTHIPPNLSTIGIGWDNNSINPAWRFSPCSYAFVAEQGWYHFRRRDLTRVGNKSFTDRVGEMAIPVVIDWAIRTDGSCQLSPEARGTSVKPTASACVSNNSYCTNATQAGHGYLCKCSQGYTGNPYITGGCKNIDECTLRKSNPAIYEKLYYCGSQSKCHDMEGDYECRCKALHRGDGKSEKGCRPIFPGYATAVVVTFVSSAILVFLLCLLHKEYRRRIRRGFFDKNGGKILKGADINIFSEDELKRITNQYSEPIGKGAFGMVFKGTIDDNQLVAVKRPIVEDEKPRPGVEFVDEITFQFQIRHSNLVRLIGCCLETKVPMLVFEFIPNGSLGDVLHNTEKPCALSLQHRIDIAIGSAEALTYMHSHAGHNNRIHGDVKSGNILLDRDLKPKVSDFGSSKLVSTASRYEKWSVCGHMSYIDPVYLKTGYFTEKSDVYSFGVVLLELITRKKVKYDESNSLPMNFLKTCKIEGNGRKMYDQDILSDAEHQSQSPMECLDRISTLAVRCLKEDLDERPTMADVVEELKHVKLHASLG